MSNETKLRDNQIFVRNLPFDCTEQNLLALFESIGPIKHVSVASDPETKKPKGFGFVTFSLAEDAKAAVDTMQGKEIHGRKIKLEISVRQAHKGKENKAIANEAIAETMEEGNPKDINQESSTLKVSENKKRKHEDNSIPLDAKESSKEDDHKASDKNDKSKKVKRDSTSAHDTKKDDHNQMNQSSHESIKTDANDARLQKSKQSMKLVAMGVPAHVDKKSFKRTLSKISRKCYVELAKQDHELSETLAILSPPGRIYIISAQTRAEKDKIVMKLNNSTNTIFERLQKDSKKENTNQEEVVNAAEKGANKGRVLVRSLHDIPTDSKIQKRLCRVIIRNLSFHATEENILTKMLSYGPVREVTLPRVAIPMQENQRKRNRVNANESGNGNEKLKSRGFAFVTFLCVSDADKAVKDSGNMKICNREVAIDYCISKTSFNKQATNEELEAADNSTTLKANKINITDDDDDDEEEDHDDGEEDEDSDEHAASDSNPRAATKKKGKDEVDHMDEESLEAWEVGGEEEENDGIIQEFDTDDEQADEDDSENEDNDDEDQQNESNKKMAKPEDVDEGCTIFLRNLPYDVEEQDLRQVFKQFGKMKFAVLVRDKDTDAPKGTAFIKYFNKANADAAISSAANSDGILVKDRACRVDLAVGRDRAQLLTSQQKISRDKRNLYLANEGLKFRPGSEEDDLPAAEKEKRRMAQSEKKKKLQNPLFFVSATRLSIRNLSKEVGNNELMRLCNLALKRGLEKKLVSLKDLENQLTAQGLSAVERAEAMKEQEELLSQGTNVMKPNQDKKHSKIIKSGKVMFDMDKVRGGAPKSRSFGFVEFSHHCHALACLREICSNSNQYRSFALSPKTPLMVEFTLENIRKVKMLEERALRTQQTRPIASNNAASSNDVKLDIDSTSRKRSRDEDTEEASQRDEDQMVEDMDEEEMERDDESIDSYMLSEKTPPKKEVAPAKLSEKAKISPAQSNKKPKLDKSSKNDNTTSNQPKASKQKEAKIANESQSSKPMKEKKIKDDSQLKALAPAPNKKAPNDEKDMSNMSQDEKRRYLAAKRKKKEAQRKARRAAIVNNSKAKPTNKGKDSNK